VSGKFSTVFKLPVFNLLSSGNNYLLPAAAFNQNLQIMVYTKNLSQSEFNSYTGGSGAGAIGIPANCIFNIRLFGSKVYMSTNEKNYIRNNVITKKFNNVQSSLSTVRSLPATLLEDDKITFICDNFNLDADAIYLCGHDLGATLKKFDLELFLGSSNYSGVIPHQISNLYRNLDHRKKDIDNFYYKCIRLSNPNGNSRQDYIPLKRYPSIRLVLTAKETVTLSNSFKNNISVIATGLSTAIYDNNVLQVANV
jgi:hypothetical protein